MATVLVAVATLLHLWTHAVANPDTDASPLDHVGCPVHQPVDHDLHLDLGLGLDHGPGDERDPHHHHDSMQHPDGFLVASGDHEMAAGSTWYPVTSTTCDPPWRARRLALGVPCRSPPYGHAARTQMTRTLEVCRR
ncbi:hypothetical protein [Actinomadura alba]|uniref:Secreted protein n=1 Tax=Actinomadura alba TaxID=406431 RepID=A0ABR7M338_9ACTN|nr:hypothetical protein [Actinomadura alba]MBC6471117.1 hypothetical protein [Actinomadura alba]